MITHGMSSSRIYSIWENMLSRCENPKHKSYDLYGGRGIGICHKWKAFEPFMKWAYKNGYNETLTLDRIDSNQNYSPENCRWATTTEQANNRRTNHTIAIDGHLITLAESAEIYGINAHMIGRRVDAGWNVLDAISLPKHHRNGHEGRIAHNARRVVRISDHKVFMSAEEAALEIRTDRSTITKACKGKLKTVRGYSFAYYEECI